MMTDPVCACGASRYETVLVGAFDRLGLQQYPFSVVRCAECGLARTLPVPDDRQYYDGYGASTTEGRFVPRDDVWSARRAAWVRARSAGGRLLDIGCNVGELVSAAGALGFDAEGIDVDPVAVAAGRELGRPISIRTLEELAESSYEVVVLSHVLEHVVDLHALVPGVARVLVPGGRAFVFVPHYRGLVARVMGQRWLFWAPHEHVWHFTPATLRARVEAASSLRLVACQTTSTLEPPSRGPKGLAKRGLCALAAVIGAGDEIEATFEQPSGS